MWSGAHATFPLARCERFSRLTLEAFLGASLGRRQAFVLPDQVRPLRVRAFAPPLHELVDTPGVLEEIAAGASSAPRAASGSKSRDGDQRGWESERPGHRTRIYVMHVTDGKIISIYIIN
jgi:hypothetical protein